MTSRIARAQARMLQQIPAQTLCVFHTRSTEIRDGERRRLDIPLKGGRKRVLERDTYIHETLHNITASQCDSVIHLVGSPLLISEFLGVEIHDKSHCNLMGTPSGVSECS